MRTAHRCIVVGSGPNGLAAAITLARAGRNVTLFEAEPTIGGGTRSGALTLPGFTHDVCAAIHPWSLRSRVLRRPLQVSVLSWREQVVSVCVLLTLG